MTNIQQKIVKRDKEFDKLVLIFQTLFNEEVIKKNTYDKMYELLKNMEASQPDFQDFTSDLLDMLHQAPVPGHQRTTVTPETMWTGEITIRGVKHAITLKRA